MVRSRRLELPRVAPLPPQGSASTVPPGPHSPMGKNPGRPGGLASCRGKSKPLLAPGRSPLTRGGCGLFPLLPAPAKPRLISGWLVGLEIMDLAFLAARRDGHADAPAGVGTAGGPVPAFLIGIDQVAIFPMHHTLAGDQGADIAVHVQPDFLHIFVEMAP